MGIIDNLRAKYEVYRLEQRYTKRDKRTTFASAAQYVDGEYIYRSEPVASKSFGGSSENWQAKRSASVRVKEMVGRVKA